MELYGTSKKVTKHLLHPDRAARKLSFNMAATRRNELPHPSTQLPSSTQYGTTEAMEDEWSRRALSRDKHGLAKLMDDLNITRERKRSEARRKSEAYAREEGRER
ncbi:hypothetical protein CERZMDRAFT_60382 [Cercospora zeae-maydis SCOH1-5]|uniref:Uncharacterized protein n=1 Tax=Cercospora zeae-maydis SCOH1-5 TaxID=717836 RepID=A0A6A6FBS0_9PEZI|nr:hypothetical protein CERZMDRAFT_60382 [Cercospora zeae-maydis SCOH1-5]